MWWWWWWLLVVVLRRTISRYKIPGIHHVLMFCVMVVVGVSCLLYRFVCRGKFDFFFSLLMGHLGVLVVK